MADDTAKKQAAPKKPTPDQVDYVIGTNKGHAERHAEKGGYPQAVCIPVTEATPELLEGKVVVLARDPQDLAINWQQIKDYDCTILK